MAQAIQKRAPKPATVFDRVLKALDVAGLCDEEIEISIRVGKQISREEPAAITKKILDKDLRVIRKDDAPEERYVLGIVLEPLIEMGKVDVQADTYSAEEVRKACHTFMADFGNMGLQHQIYVNGKVKVLENWIATDDCLISGQSVTKGTWLMGVRVVDDDLWSAVKDGKLTGFSIGGYAKREPVA